MFSQTSEYALRVMVFLASRGDQPATTRQIAQATQVPQGYLSKVLQSLSRAELVRSQRGLHGGSTLAKAPSVISVYDVVCAVDSVQRIRSCPLGIASHGQNLCPLHRRMDDALALAEQALRDSTLADLLAEPTTSKPLCSLPGIR